MAQFARMQDYAAALHELISAAGDHAPPRSEGTDRSGAVSVVLDPDGLPGSLRLRSDWDRRIGPAALGDAVLDACQTATGRRMAAWTASLRDAGWQDRIERFRNERFGGPAHATSRSTPRGDPPTPDQIPEITPRRLGDIAEDVIASVDQVSESIQRPPPPHRGTGTAGGGRLTLTLSRAGLTSCVVDPRWAAAQTSVRLTAALNSALAAARRDLAGGSAETEPVATVDRLLAETMALLGDPRRLADGRGHRR